LHISIVAYGTWGDVRPGIALALALKEVGYGVRLIVTEDFAALAKRTELDVHSLPINTFELMKPVSSKTNALRVVRALHQEVAPALLKAGQSLLALAEDTGGFVVNEWFLGIARSIAEAHQLKLLNLATQPQIRTRQMPIATMPSLPGWVLFRETYNLLSYDLAYYVRWFSYVRQVNSLRKTYLNLAPLSSGEFLDLIDRTPSITLISRHVMPRPADWQDHHHVTGFLFYDDEGWGPAAELEEFIDAGEPPVYVGFGSLHDPHPQETTRLILEALKPGDRRAVVYKGWSDLGGLDLPDTVHLLDYAPHSWLFPRMAAVVHHAGAGTSAAALRAGVPSVPVPHSGDQPFWARRLYQIGAATRPLPRNRLTAADLAEGIASAVRDSRLRSRASDLRARISAEDGAGRTVSAINELFKK
jgi:sterol 3beta-glucosyltransferase